MLTEGFGFRFLDGISGRIAGRTTSIPYEKIREDVCETRGQTKAD